VSTLNEKMLIDTLSFLSTCPEGAGFNEIARYLARRGFTPLYGGRVQSGDRSTMLHPVTLTRLLENASNEEFIETDHPLGQCPKGEKNRFYLTKKGRAHLARKEEIRFIEDSDSEEVNIFSKVVEEKFFAAESQLDNAALNFSKPLGPGDRLTTPEDIFFANRNVKLWARKLLSASRIRLFARRGSHPPSLTIEQIEQLSFLLVAYAGGPDGFSIVLSYDPIRRDPETNPKLVNDLLDLELSHFFMWLRDFKHVTIDADDFRTLLPHVFGSQVPESELTEDVRHYKKLWAEFAAKRERVDKTMAEIRDYQSEFDEWKARGGGFLFSP